MTDSHPTSPATSAATPLPPAGWYPDGLGGQRWWDGTAWSEHRAPLVMYIAPAPAPAPRRLDSANRIATASFVLAVVGLILVLLPGAAFLCGLLALIFGVVGLQRVPWFHGEGRVMSIWGLAIGCLELFGSIAWLVVAVITNR